MFEVFDHTADVGIRAVAKDISMLFSEAARGLFSLIVVKPNELCEARQVNIEFAGDDLEYLLFDWLTELLFHYETNKLLFRRFDVRMDDQGLHAVCFGEPVDDQRHQLDHEIKAITYHDLTVKQDGENWVAEVIVDI